MYFEKNKWNVWIKVWAFKSPSALASVKWCWTNVSKCLLVSRKISFISLLQFDDVVTGDLPLHVNTIQASNYTVYRRVALEKLLIFLNFIKNMWYEAGKCQGLLVWRAGPEKNGKEAPVWGVAQFGEMSYPGR